MGLRFCICHTNNMSGVVFMLTPKYIQGNRRCYKVFSDVSYTLRGLTQIQRLCKDGEDEFEMKLNPAYDPNNDCFDLDE